MSNAKEREWVNVANDQLAKCNLDLQVDNLSDCGAKVFICLYESMLGEQVPDFISAPNCQEDDAHNVQSIIDSLALDYLQVSLSHITGENIVKGDKESIINLLEIFDGLLEYLTEDISETVSENNDDPNQTTKDEVPSELPEQLVGACGRDAPTPSSKLTSAVGSQSSEFFVPSWELDGSESTSDLIKLGDTAYLFSQRNEDLPAEEDIPKRTNEPEQLPASLEPSSILPSSQEVQVTEIEGPSESAALPREQLRYTARKLGEPLHSAIALRPPRLASIPRSMLLVANGYSNKCFPLLAELSSSVSTEPPGQESKTPTDGTISTSRNSSDLPTGDEPVTKADTADLTVEPVPDDDVVDTRKETDEPVQYKPMPCFEKDSYPSLTSIQSTRPKQRNLFKGESQSERSATDSLAEEPPLSPRSAKKRASDRELQKTSEKLTRMLNEVDAMLKNALGDRIKESSKDEDILSQHSDSAMDYRKMKPEPAILLPRSLSSRQRSRSSSPPPADYLSSNLSGTLQKGGRVSSRQRSLSSSPPPSIHHLSSALGGPLQRDEPIRKVHDRLQMENDLRRLRAKLMTKSYEDDLRAYEASEKFELAKLKVKSKEREQKYKEYMSKKPRRVSQPAKIYLKKNVARNPRASQRISRGGVVKPKRAAHMKVKENDLLPLLMEEFPHLHVSHPTMNKLWQKQFLQIEQLKPPADKNRLKLESEVAEALKKHDLLVELIKKQQSHNTRLQELQYRIHQQKYNENKMRERRQQVARAQKYYQDYRIQLRAKLMKSRTREEQIFKNLFEEGLDIQKKRLQELRLYSKEKRAEQMKQHQDELASMENYYKDQFAMLAEAVSDERQEIQAREKAHTKTLNKVKQEMRSKMEKEIQELQTMITQADDDSCFRELEADRLKSRLQMASFQFSKNYHFL